MQISFGGGNAGLAQIITAWAALIAALLGPLAGYLAAKHQAHRSIVSVNRQKWVDELRGEVADFLTACAGISTENHGSDKYRSGDPHNATKEHIFKLGRLLATIELRLNPNEEDHKDLIQKLDACIKSAAENGNFADDREAALKSAKKVLKREWERVKKGS